MERLIIAIIHLFHFHVRVTSTEQPLTRRLIGFQENLLGKRLDVSPIRTLRKVQKTHCILDCMKTFNCTSVNFCGKTICELNPDDIYSQPDSLVTDPFCNYFGMEKHEIPVCEEFRVLKDIQDDSQVPNICGINGKRVDGFWKPVGHVDIDNSTDYRKMSVPQCIQGNFSFSSK